MRQLLVVSVWSALGRAQILMSAGAITRRIRVGLVALVGVLIILQSFGVSSARAGGYTITANGAQVCALGTFIQNVPGFGATCDDSDGDVFLRAPDGGSAFNDRQLWEIDSPSSALTITGANLSAVSTNGINTGDAGYGGGAYWNGGGQPLNVPTQSEEPFGSDSTGGAFSSQYFGLQILCSDSRNCDGTGTEANAYIANLGTVSFAIQENQAPSLTADGSNLFYQTTGWVWNAPGDPWPASATGTDPSGVCTVTVAVNGTAIGQVSSPQNTTIWQQCPSPQTDNASVDTTSFVPTSGQLSLGLSDTNAAGVSSSGTHTIDVDNVQPAVGISPLDDSNPGGWSVNHSVTLQVTPTAGPSGISSFSCTDTVGANTTPLTTTAGAGAGTYNVTIDGNGAHTVSCSAANGAVNPQGAHNTGSASEAIDIDEQPPTMSFEATNPSNPDQVIVDISDDESPVNGGAIQITAQGSSTPTALPTTFNSAGQLIATIPDATLKAGAYTLGASATSQVGNTGMITEPVTLPLRSRSSSIVSFKKIVDPRLAKKVMERVRVGFLYKIEKKHGKKVKVKVGGHFETITVIKRVERCTTKRVKIAAHKYKLKRTCTAPKLSFTHKATVGHGKKTTIYGELTTSQNVALAGQTVEILATPKNGNGKTRRIGSVVTNATGGWSAKVAAGPSRTIRGYYAGTDSTLPTSGSVLEFVPARVKLMISPTALPWGAVMRLSGMLVGGYVPAKGVAMRILIKIPGLTEPYVSSSFRTTAKGRFSFRYVAPTISQQPETLHLAVDMVGAEDGYPFTPHRSEWVKVRFGVKAPHHKRK